jgi:Sec-independent protein translocase protein TatA
MKKLISLVVTAIAAIAGFKAAIKARDERIAELESQVKADEADDSALEQRAKDAEARTAEFERLDSEANGKADELAGLLNEEPAVPSVDPATFAVTSPATGSIPDLEFRDREAETKGVGLPPTPPAEPGAGDADK